jgi:hypothetical protein
MCQTRTFASAGAHIGTSRLCTRWIAKPTEKFSRRLRFVLEARTGDFTKRLI